MTGWEVCLCAEKGGLERCIIGMEKGGCVIVIKYCLIGGGVIWAALFLIVVSLGLESPSCSHQQSLRNLFLDLVFVHPRLCSLFI
jgi:hypothetical protein